VVWAITALINEPRAAGQVFNIGNVAEISIRDLALRVRELTGSRSELIYTPYEKAFDNSFEDMPRRVPDIGKIHRLLGYEPRVQLDGIIESVIRYWDVAGTRQKAHTVDRQMPRAGYVGAPVALPQAV